MPILDGDNIFGEAVANTAIGTYASDVIDLGAEHTGHNSKVIITIPTAFASSASATVTFNILCDSVSTMASPTTLYTTGALAYSALTAGTLVCEFTLPWEVERYIEIQEVIATGALTAGAYNAYLDSARQANLS